MSMIPEPRYWPIDEKKVSNGIPKMIDKKVNLTKKIAEKL
jgi:hypothetical protein